MGFNSAFKGLNLTPYNILLCLRVKMGLKSHPLASIAEIEQNRQQLSQPIPKITFQ